jgi:hypothetical protein
MAALALLGAGCVHGYPQPSLDEPHAEVRIRVTHHDEPGPLFEEPIRMGPFDVSLAEVEPGVREGAMRVRAEPIVWTFRTRYYHWATRTSRELAWQAPAVPPSSSPLGPAPPMPAPVPVTDSRSQPVRVWDGGCWTNMPQRPLAGAAYLVEYDFVGFHDCRASCQRLLPGPNGGLRAIACGEDEPAPDASVPPADLLSRAPASLNEPTAGETDTTPTETTPASALAPPR